MGLKPDGIVMVSDIGCSGLFDTFFATHALHGLHGRALTYAAGIKLARPHLKVVVTMGDGGLGIGGSHFLAACRRNLDLTLLILNNFNFGMTGGQFSCTTPAEASVASGFLNTIELPMDICRVAAAAGAPFAARCSVYQKNLPQLLFDAIGFEGFSVVDIWGTCTGHYMRRNPLGRQDMERRMSELRAFEGPVPANRRPEYGGAYREAYRPAGGSGSEGLILDAVFERPIKERREIVLLGAAGDRIISAGSLLAQAAILGGMRVTQKNDYDITVMRGPSVSDLVISPEPILYTGVERPDVVVALAREGVQRKRGIFAAMSPAGRIILNKGLEIPDTAAQVMEVDFKGLGIKRTERALAALALLAGTRDPISPEMLEMALRGSLSGKALDDNLDLTKRMSTHPHPQ
jgi:Pyruvate/2-oxoacid:ferredoxin oxidoreductase gamma subunit